MKKTAAFKRLCKKHDVDPELIPEITSFEDACLATGRDPKKLPGVTSIPKEHRKRIIADYKLTIIAEALREGKQVDYTNQNSKYFPVFKVQADEERPSGFGLSYDVTLLGLGYDCRRSPLLSKLGSRGIFR
jgi:hypothetical protein